MLPVKIKWGDMKASYNIGRNILFLQLLLKKYKHFTQTKLKYIQYLVVILSTGKKKLAGGA